MADLKAAGSFLRSVRKSKGECQGDVGMRAEPRWNSSGISDIELGNKETMADYLPKIVQAYQLTKEQEDKLRGLLGLTTRVKRPKGITTFRTSADNKAKLAELARREHRTVSNLVNLAVREFLERQATQ